MKVVLVTLITPASENIRGTSALPYHLIKGAVNNDNDNGNANEAAQAKLVGDMSYEIEIYSFNANKLSNEKIAEVEKELGVTIKVMPLPKWFQWMFKFHLLFLRVFLKYPFVNYIKLSKKTVDEIRSSVPDFIWVYGEELSRIVKQFPNLQRMQLGPDTESLFYYRLMSKDFVVRNKLSYWKNVLMYRKYARMEQQCCTDDSFTYYAVGEEDVRHMQVLNPKVQAKFLRHPHYEVNNNDNGTDTDKQAIGKKFHSPKIKLLIAGQYNVYMQQDADALVQHLCCCGHGNDNGLREAPEHLLERKNILQEHYVLTFLGKGWEKHVETLRGAGYEVHHIKFAPDYIEEICEHDIQITPISIGTGTKGKVLDALANGLLVIGTPYAMENIAVKHGVSCVEYRHPQEVIDVLIDIVQDENGSDNRKKYEAMAAAGRDTVLTLHSPKRIAGELFGLLRE